MTPTSGAVAHLASDLSRLPERVLAAAEAPFLLPRGLRDARRVHVTGVGSSAGHARFLVERLQHAGTAAAFTPLSRFAAGSPGTPDEDALVVFSQGLSPNARLALAEARSWRAAPRP